MSRNRRDPPDPVAPLRSAYFACLKQIGIVAKPDRHRWNLENGLPESTGDWSLADWRAAVAALQTATGRKDVQPGKPHLRGSSNRKSQIANRKSPLPAILSGGASGPQLNFLEDLLAGFVWWTPDAEQLLLAQVAFLKREKHSRDQWVRGNGSRATLSRPQASRVIQALSPPGPNGRRWATSLKIISFARTTPNLLAGRKTATRRTWQDGYAKRFHAGDVVAAYDRSPRVGGRPVAVIQLERDPYKQPLNALSPFDLAREGTLWEDTLDFILAFCDASMAAGDCIFPDHPVWVIEFRLLALWPCRQEAAT